MTEFKFEKHSEPPYNIYWAEGPCARCGTMIQGEWEEDDNEKKWWCSGCWKFIRIEQLEAEVKDERAAKEEAEEKLLDVMKEVCIRTVSGGWIPCTVVAADMLRQAVRERDEPRAARIAYASEFDGDVGNIHENIRKLKVQLAEAKAEERERCAGELEHAARALERLSYTHFGAGTNNDDIEVISHLWSKIKALRAMAVRVLGLGGEDIVKMSDFQGEE